MANPRRAALAFGVVGLCFWSLYFCTGWQVARHGLFLNDVFFHSDTERVVNDIAVFDVSHRRTNVHPLFVLLVNPLGLLIAHLTGSPSFSAVLLNSATGGLSIALAGWFLYQASIPLRRACLYAVFLGCSAGRIYFGSVPETYAFSGLSIVILFCCSLKAPGGLRAFVPAGLFSFGVLITNLGFAAIAFLGSIWSASTFRQCVQRTALYLAIIIGLGTSLAFLQKAIWPRSEFFFMPVNYSGEERFIKVPDEPRALHQRVILLSRHVFAFDWVTPRLVSEPNQKHGIRVGFDPHSLGKIHRYGRLTVSLWLCLLAAALFAFFYQRKYAQPLPASLALGLLFHFVLHTLYGDDLFLYACNSDFLVLAWVALCTAELPPIKRYPALADSLLGLLIIFECLNNGPFLHALASFQK